MMKSLTGAGLAALAMIAASTTTASAEPPKFAWSFNIGATNDYVFRGFSQRRDDVTAFGGLDFTYGIAYVGVWAAGVDFDLNTDGTNVASYEVDLYAGIKPTLGPVTFDLGVIYYAYPNAKDGGPAKGQAKEQDYVELKGGASGAIVPGLPKLTLGGVLYYTNEYQGGQNEVLTAEATAAYELPSIMKFTPTLSALLGAQYGDAGDGFTLANGDDELMYWNAGITFAIEKFSFDFRYWDTDIKESGSVLASDFCSKGFNGALMCDERFVFTAKFTY